MDLEIKVGDTVKRVNGKFSGMHEGNTDLVIGISGNSLKLKYYGLGHDKVNFRVIKKAKVIHELWI